MRSSSGHVEERPAIEVEEVERLEHEAGRGLVTELGLEEAEVGPTVIVERDDLAIDDGLRASIQRAGFVRRPREVARGVVQVARPGADVGAVHHGLQAEAVPLDLEQPVRVA